MFELVCFVGLGIWRVFGVFCEIEDFRLSILRFFWIIISMIVMI